MKTKLPLLIVLFSINLVSSKSTTLFAGKEFCKKSDNKIITVDGIIHDYIVIGLSGVANLDNTV